VAVVAVAASSVANHEVEAAFAGAEEECALYPVARDGKDIQPCVPCKYAMRRVTSRNIIPESSERFVPISDSTRNAAKLTVIRKGFFFRRRYRR